MLDHANIGATAELIVNWFDIDGDIRCLLVLPLLHVNGIMVSVVSPLLAGGSRHFYLFEDGSGSPVSAQV
jgi:long-chain acyl-CoA synthetase